MLYKIMDMHILLYAMAGVGVLGILGMAAEKTVSHRT